jgi:hypothetical protein
MSDFLTADRSGAVPIMPVRAESFPAWLDRHSRSREWLSRIGFKAEPGTFAFLPGADGRAEAIVASPASGAPVYAFAGLPTALPEGKYVLELEEQVCLLPMPRSAGRWAPMRSMPIRRRSARRRRWFGPRAPTSVMSSGFRAACFSRAT